MLLPATPGWVSLPVVVGGPRHSWLRSPGGGGVWWVCGWCVVCLVPRHSWRRFLCATPRHSWLGFAACGGVRFPATPGWGLLAAVVRGAWCVVCGVWCAAVVCWWGCGCGWSLATPGGGSCVLLPATPGWVSMPVAVGGPRHSWLRALGAVSRHSWLGFAGGGGVWWGCGWCVVCLVPRHSWRRFLCATPRHSWLGFAACGGVRFPATPGWGLLAAVVRGAWCVVCGVWCAAVVCWWGCGCGWSLATPGGGSCVLLPATTGWVSMPVAVGGPRHSWLRALGAVSRHSWLGFAGGGGVWWGCGWCVVCLVPRHSWRRFLCATPRHSWLGFAACGGVRFPATPGWGLLAAVVRGAWCVVCGVWCAAVVCWWGCGCGWSLATPGGGSCVLLPATPGWVSMPVAVGGPRHSWLRALGAVPRHSWLGFAGGGGVWWGCGWCVVWLVPRHPWRSFLCATPRHSWLGFAAGGGVRFPATPGWGLLAVLVRGVLCVVCGGGVLAGLWVVCGVVGPSPLLAEVPVCYSPPLLAGFRCRWWWAVPATPGWGPLAAVVCGVWRWCVGCWSLATPGGGSCVLLPATPGWVSLPAVVGVPRHSWRRVPGAVPRHSWLGFAVGGGAWCAVCGVRRVACGGGVCGGFVAGVVGPSPLLAEVPVCYSPPLLAGFRCRWWCGVVLRWVCLPSALPRGPGVCVCAVWPFVLVWVAWGGGGVALGVAVVRARACARGVWLVGWGVSYLGWFSSSVVGMFQKAEEEVL